jgi:RNA polymerase sigma-70 factor (ECF subfamily)
MRRVTETAGMQRELVERAIEGDREAFTQLVDGTIDRQYAVATLILRDADRAKDAVQEALVSAWRDVRTLRDPGAWEAWLHRLTVRACYRAARKERRRDVVELRVLPGTGSPDAQDPSTAIAERDRLARRLGDLPIDQRTVVVLHFYLDRPITEVAGILDIPVGTAKSRLQRGIVGLRAAMGDEPDAERATPREGAA